MQQVMNHKRLSLPLTVMTVLEVIPMGMVSAQVSLGIGDIYRFLILSLILLPILNTPWSAMAVQTTRGMSISTVLTYLSNSAIFLMDPPTGHIPTMPHGG